MIYILKFSGKLGNEKHQAEFYIGYCEEGRVNERLAEHRNGQGAAITRAAVERGFELTIVLTLPGDRKTERRLKNRNNARLIVERALRGTLRL